MGGHSAADGQGLPDVVRPIGSRSAAYRFGTADEYEIRVVSSPPERERAWALVYRAYREKGYAAPNEQGLWYGLHDALPRTTTFLVERRTEDRTAPVAAMTLFFDSPLHLPADDAYRLELDALRERGRTICEIGSLACMESDPRRGLVTLKHLFKLAYLVAWRLEQVTDLVITVNPGHASFYRRKLLLEELGPECAYAKVSGAPALLLGLDLETAEDRYAEHYGREPGGFFGFFVDPATEPGILGTLSAARRPLDEAALRRYFMTENPILELATAQQRAVIEDEYLHHLPASGGTRRRLSGTVIRRRPAHGCRHAARGRMFDSGLQDRRGA
jgi:hypothetical protein